MRSNAILFFGVLSVVALMIPHIGRWLYGPKRWRGKCMATTTSITSFIVTGAAVTFYTGSLLQGSLWGMVAAALQLLNIANTGTPD